MPYLETSAATGQNINRAIDTLLDMVMLRMEIDTDRSILLRKAKDTRKLEGNDDENDLNKCSC